jgi:hypothetical protein
MASEKFRAVRHVACLGGLAFDPAPAPPPARGEEATTPQKGDGFLGVPGAQWLTMKIGAAEKDQTAVEWSTRHTTFGGDFVRRWIDEAIAQRDRNADIHSRLNATEARNTELLAALAVFGIEPPENDGEEWIVSTDNEPVPAGDTAVDAARFVNRIDTATEARLAEAERERNEALMDYERMMAERNATTAELEAETKRADAAVAIAREAEAEILRLRALALDAFRQGRDEALRLAQIGGKGG